MQWARWLFYSHENLQYFFTKNLQKKFATKRRHGEGCGRRSLSSKKNARLTNSLKLKENGKPAGGAIMQKKIRKKRPTIYGFPQKKNYGQRAGKKRVRQNHPSIEPHLFSAQASSGVAVHVQNDQGDIDTTDDTLEHQKKIFWLTDADLFFYRTVGFLSPPGASSLCDPLVPMHVTDGHPLQSMVFSSEGRR